jgi:uncharacterized membrane protein YgcG
VFTRNHKLAVLDWGLALVVGALLISPVLAAEEAKELKTGEKAILAALEEKTVVDFIDEPLSAVVDYFKFTHKIEIQIDAKALETVNLGSDTPITKNLRNIKLRSALNLILHDLDLTWIIADEVMVITTPEEAENHLITRVYDVGVLVTVQDPDGNRWQDFDSLIDAIVSTVAPDTWEEVGGLGSIAELEYRGAVVLIVRQRLDIHAQVGELLKDLTEIADKYGDEVIPTREKPQPQPPGPGMEGFPGGMGGGGMGGGGMGGGGMGGGGMGGGGMGGMGGKMGGGMM